VSVSDPSDSSWSPSGGVILSSELTASWVALGDIIVRVRLVRGVTWSSRTRVVRRRKLRRGESVKLRGLDMMAMQERNRTLNIYSVTHLHYVSLIGSLRHTRRFQSTLIQFSAVGIKVDTRRQIFRRKENGTCVEFCSFPYVKLQNEFNCTMTKYVRNMSNSQQTRP
jgi:hypothetical protein